VRSTRQNVGSRAHPRPEAEGCIAADALPLGAAGADAGTTECIWDPSRPFRGWQADHVGAAPASYARYLRDLAI
jgi:hypothetical protein